MGSVTSTSVVRRQNAGTVRGALTPEETARRQQEHDDEMLARRLALEEATALGLPPEQVAGLGLVPPAIERLTPVGISRGTNETRRSSEATCPFCGDANDYDEGLVNCTMCSGQFQVLAQGSGGSPAQTQTATPGHSFQMCRRCGTVNQFPTPPAGQPLPEVQCGVCGAVTPASAAVSTPAAANQGIIGSTPHQRRLIRAQSSPAGPMVRVTVGGHRRVIPLTSLLNLMADEAHRGNPAQASDIAALPTRKFCNSDALREQKKCLVCLEEFGDGDDLKTLPCLHIYHQHCVEHWLRTDNSCPVCKTRIGRSCQESTGIPWL